MGDVKEWARNGSFMKKPTSGWLHDDQALSVGDGVYYPVKYVGKVAMTMSMRALRFEDRTAITREAITMACEAAGIRPVKKRKVPPIVRSALAGEAKVMNLNIKFTVSTAGIALVVIGTNSLIANHIMPGISFATGGEAEDYDVIGYVAKDSRNVREVHVFDCGHMAHDVMATIGQAFELRYKAFLRKQNTGSSFPGGPPPVRRGLPAGHDSDAIYDDADTKDLYSDLPGAEGYHNDENPYGSTGYHNEESAYDTAPGPIPVVGRAPVMYGDDTAEYDNKAGKSISSGYTYSGEALYDHARGKEDELNFETQYDAASGSKDYDDTIADGPGGSSLMRAPAGSELERPLRTEKWFHGPLRREAADMMLRKNGDFLVRENMQAPGQFILSSLQAGNFVHLLLVDPAGRVRTKDTMFNGVSHLINYHLRAKIPIVAHGSRVMLGEPVVNMSGTQDGVYG